MILQVFDVEHGACAIVQGPNNALAMIDCGHNDTSGWRPSTHLQYALRRRQLEYLLISNVDQDHISDLENLLGSGVAVHHVLTNYRVAPEHVRLIKQISGPLTGDAEAYLRMRTAMTTGQPGVPFDQGMGGVTVRSYGNSFPDFVSTNDLSSVYFLSYGTFKIVFPGDVEKAGWRRLLQDQNFVNDLRSTTIYVASHHGRESGYCEEVFRHLSPQAVVISDKSIAHDTQLVDHRRVVNGNGVNVQTGTGRASVRQVLTTRSDGHITFNVQLNGQYGVSTSSG